MNVRTVATAGIAVIVMSVSCGAPDQDAAIDSRVDHALGYAVEQLRESVSLVDYDEYPRRADADNGWYSSDLYEWTSGFFPGCLWYAYDITGEDDFRQWAAQWTANLEPLKSFTGTHDLGFMMYCSYGNGYRLTGSGEYRDILVETAQSLASRYSDTTGVIKSWDFNEDVWEYPVIIDNMMNLELLFWAAKITGQTELYRIAEEHARNTMANHVREDGGSYHVVDYDAGTGEVRGKYTHQGYARDSTWARGQAWGIYGFTMAYRETGNEQFLETACRMADYFIGRLPADYIPYWDFDAPDIPDEPRDSSAAAIAASGMLELSTYMSDTGAHDLYRNAAVHILSELCGPGYLTEGTANPAILMHAVGSRPAQSEVDVSLIYGDYYFIEALLRYRDSI